MPSGRVLQDCSGALYLLHPRLYSICHLWAGSPLASRALCLAHVTEHKCSLVLRGSLVSAMQPSFLISQICCCCNTFRITQLLQFMLRLPQLQVKVYCNRGHQVLLTFDQMIIHGAAYPQQCDDGRCVAGKPLTLFQQPWRQGV